MRYFDLYGSRTMSVDDLAGAAAAALGITFVARDSLYKGAYFDADLRGGGTIEVRPNYVRDLNEDEVIETRFADRSALLYVHRSERGRQIEEDLKQIPDLELLRRDTRD